MPPAFLSGSSVPGEYPLLLHLSDSLLWPSTSAAQFVVAQHLLSRGCPSQECLLPSVEVTAAISALPFVIWHLSIMSYFFGWGTQLTWSWKADLWWQESFSSWLWSNCNLGLDCFSKRQQRVLFSALLIITCMTIGRFYNLLGSLFVH